jgi:hypothetical protein
MVMKRLCRAFRKSPWLGVKVVADRAVDWVEERRLGIHTGGLIPIETLMEDWEGNHDYAPTSIRALRKFFAAVILSRARMSSSISDVARAVFWCAPRSTSFTRSSGWK